MKEAREICDKQEDLGAWKDSKKCKDERIIYIGVSSNPLRICMQWQEPTASPDHHMDASKQTLKK